MSTENKKMPDIETFLSRVLPGVSRPGRYIGGEVNARGGIPSPGDVRVCLAFPEAYEIGMSHQGSAVILDILNGMPGVFAERTFAVWPDMEARMKEAGVPLFSLETKTALADFDIVGFSLMYELTYANLVVMLEMAKIPVFSRDRDGRFPLVIAGGSCAFNPEPVADMLDAVVIGDGEEVTGEIVRAYREGRTTPREDLLARLARIPGVYVPRFYGPEYRDGAFLEMRRHGGVPAAVKKRTVTDLDTAPCPRAPVIPHVQAVHDRISVEIARGCARGCRFCQAGYIYRPVREREQQSIERIMEERLCATGMEEVSLLSLSSGDYSCVGSLMGRLMERLSWRRVALSVPSLRVDTLTDEMIAEIRRVRKTGFTIAPEAGSDRLRAVINKNVTEAEIEETVQRVFKAGWRLIKLYFMIGLPTETDEDIDELIALVKKIEGGLPGRTRGAMNVSISTFIPKPHTPFQWEGMAAADVVRERQERIRRSIRSRNVSLSFHDRRMSLLEAVLSRGDRRLGPVIIRAASKGCRFDGWSEQFRFDLWEEAFREEGLTMEQYARWAPSTQTSLPWDHIDTGVSRQYLASERERAYGAETTVGCVTDRCVRCGVCGSDVRTVRTSEEKAKSPSIVSAADVPASPAERLTYLFFYTRKGLMRFLSHLEVACAIERALMRAGVPVNFTEGFHPKPRISFAGALPVGVEARREPFWVELSGDIDTGVVMNRLNETLPEGLSIVGIVAPTAFSGKKSADLGDLLYRVSLPENGLPLDEVPGLIAGFLDRSECWYEASVKGVHKRIDVRPYVRDVTYRRSDRTIDIMMKKIGGSSPSPYRVIAAILGMSEPETRMFFVVKEAAPEPQRDKPVTENSEITF